jgi:hypothetical protein
MYEHGVPGKSDYCNDVPEGFLEELFIGTSSP